MKLRYSEFADRLDIDAFENAIGFTPASQKNNEDTGQCPDLWGLHKHGDTTGKFSINRDKRVYNCWVCGGGSLLSLAMSVNDLDPSKATEWLYEFTNDEEVKGNELEDQLERIFEQQRISVDETTFAMPYFNEKVLERFDSAYHPWCEERGITPEGQKSFGVRFSGSHEKRSKQGEVYRGRAIIIPHYWEGTSGWQLVGWQERWLDDRPDWLGKYTNTPGFPREETLFNYWGCHGDWDLPPICVVESATTVMFLESIGIPAVATFGAQVTMEQINLLRVFKQGVILCADNDNPGIIDVVKRGKTQLSWRTKLTENLENHIPVWWSPLIGKPESGNDLGNLSHDPKLVETLIKQAYLPLEEELDRSLNI